MSSKPLVSVVMIFLNAERFIQEAIDSVFAQTYRRWELLLVDDGSTDGSSEMARQYTAHDPDKVRYLEHAAHQNLGMSASRNLGLRQAQGEYIAFLDADDVWRPQKLEQQVAILNAQPAAAMVYGPTQWWYSWTERPEDRLRDFVHEPGVPTNTLVSPPTLLLCLLQNGGVSPCTCSVLVRREAIERVGGFEESFRGLYEDQAFFAKLSSKEPIFVADKCWARYRQHPNSNCSVMQQTGQDEAARQMFLNWLFDYLSRENITQSEVWHILRQELWPYRHQNLHRLMQFAQRSVVGRVYRAARHRAPHWTSLPVIRTLRCLWFRRLQPIGNGRQRGTPIVRYYWAHYLQQHQSDIRGKALEIGATATLRQYGGQAVTQANAMDLEAHSPEITVVADLSRADYVPADVYDCFVNQFTMHLIYDVEAALYHAIRILKPGGVLLINFPCVDYYFPTGLDMGTGAPLFMYWWFTPILVENLLRHMGLAQTDYQIDLYGNLFARIAYQLNLPAEALTRRELEYMDAGHPVLICTRVVKPVNWQAAKPEYRNSWRPDVTPAHWNPETGHYAAKARL